MAIPCGFRTFLLDGSMRVTQRIKAGWQAFRQGATGGPLFPFQSAWSAAMNPFQQKAAPFIWPDWRTGVFSENARGRMVRTARYKYCWYKNGNPRDMLIDMEDDPGEMKNLAVDPKYAPVIAEHRELLRTHVREHHDTLFANYAD